MRDWNLEDLLLWHGYDGAIAEIERKIGERLSNPSGNTIGHAINDVVYIEELVFAKNMAIRLKAEYEDSGREFPVLSQFFGSVCPMIVEEA